MANMLAYPGRTFGQLYHRFFLVNELAGGTLSVNGDRSSTWPTLSSRCSPSPGRPTCWPRSTPCTTSHSLLPNSPDVRVETAPGGHLGV